MFLGLLLSLTLLAGDDLEERAPTAKVKPHTAYAWKSEGDLRYVWWLPKGYDEEEPRHLTVIMHGTGLDYRWGYWNNKPKIFRPDDVVVSVDGPSPGQGDTRLFLGDKQNANAIRDFLEEMRKVFAVDHVFLYGHSQGGFFVVYYAGEYPDTVNGVVAHASGAWNWSKMGKDVKKVPIAFMHGTADPVVPYRQSPGSRDAYVDAKFPMVHLRRMPGYNHWPNAVRANEALGWCEGMSTDDPAHALEVAKELLRPKKPDEYQYTTPASFSGARDVLRRFEDQGARPFEDVPEKLQGEARKMIGAVEAAGDKHVTALRKSISKKLDFKEGAALAHLVALREDFRGVDAVEAYVKDAGFDKLAEKHAKAASDVFEAWYSDSDSPGEKFETIVGALPKAFLYDGYPPELGKKLRAWEKNAKSLKIGKKALKAWKAVEAWLDGQEKGDKAYSKIWKAWKGV